MVVEMVCIHRRWTNYCLLLILCCYVVVFMYYDSYVFESVLLMETWIKTQMALRSDESAKVMFALDKNLLLPR